MKRHGFLLLVLLAAAGCAKEAVKAVSESAWPPAKLTGTYATLQTSHGEIVLHLLSRIAPKTVENFVGLASGKKAWKDPRTGKMTTRSLYDGTRFFRTVPGFMIQGGDPSDSGEGGPGFTFEDEFNAMYVFDRAGIIAMANNGPDTNGSQFFITLADTRWLDRKHTIFGEVVKGMDVVEAIAAAPRIGDSPLGQAMLQSVKIEER